MSLRIGRWLGLFLLAALVETLLLPPGGRPPLLGFQAAVALIALIALRAGGASRPVALLVTVTGALAAAGLKQLLGSVAGPVWVTLLRPAVLVLSAVGAAALLSSAPAFRLLGPSSPGMALSTRRLAGVIVCLLAAGLVPATLSAAGQTGLDLLGGTPSSLGLVWRRTWLAQLAGAFLAAPLLVTWALPRRPRPSLGRSQRPEAVLLVLLLVAVAAFIFNDWLSTVVAAPRLPYLVYPLLIWAALRFGPGGVTAALLLVAWVAVWGTAHGQGPFQRPAFDDAALFCQVFVIISVVTLLMLGAVFQERLEAEAQLGQAKEELESRVASRTGELRTSLEEKEVLLKEIHHRVKNNLQIISSLLYLQGRKIAVPEVQALLAESQARVRSMALVHERLYQSSDLASVDLGSYLEALVAHLVRTFAREGSVSVEVKTDGIRLPVDTAIPCGLIVNELCTNALKHAFTGRAEGTVRITVHREMGPAGDLILEVTDNGAGLPAGMVEASSGSLGLQLVNSLALQLRARHEMGSGSWGTRFSMRFPSAPL